MKLAPLFATVLIATPAHAQTPPTDPDAAMGRVLAVFRMIDRTPDEVMDAFLSESGPQDRIIATTGFLPDDLNDPQAVVFGVVWAGKDPYGADSIGLRCIRFGPATLDYVQRNGALTVGAMILGGSQDGWTGSTPGAFPELGQPQSFPHGAILRQDCAVTVGLPGDYPVQPLNDWPDVALAAIKKEFGKVTVEDLGQFSTPNRRLGVRASDPLGEPGIQVRLLEGALPYRPYDDLRMPAFGLELRAATYLFARDS